MNHIITLENCKSYKTEENLHRGLKKYGLDTGEFRYIIARTPEGKWTAIFLISEYVNVHGGYIGIAAQFGFMSI